MATGQNASISVGRNKRSALRRMPTRTSDDSLRLPQHLRISNDCNWLQRINAPDPDVAHPSATVRRPRRLVLNDCDFNLRHMAVFRERVSSCVFSSFRTPSSPGADHSISSKHSARIFCSSFNKHIHTAHYAALMRPTQSACWNDGDLIKPNISAPPVTFRCGTTSRKPAFAFNTEKYCISICIYWFIYK